MNDFGITQEDAVNELSYIVEEASNFMFTEFEKDWETGEAYFAGKSTLPTEAGRSTMVKTEVRDVIRALMPNMMRVLMQARKPVVYLPNSVMTSMFAEQQSHYVVQLFKQNDGYRVLYNAIQEAFKLKAGPVKTYWEENPEPEHIYVTGITAAEVEMYDEQPDIVIESVEEHTDPTGGDKLYDLRATRYYENGKIRMVAFPIYEFFVERDADNLEDYVHGHRRSVKVSEAIEMGLEYDDWRELSNDDPKKNDAVAAEEQRRGYHTNKGESGDVDVMNVEFLLTEAYCKYDMDGDGVPERYVFFLGGTSYTYLHHEQIEDFCIDIVCADPIPFTVIGRSIVDVTKQSQDTETSVLRAIIDNALIANNPRPAADPTKTNFEDLMNNAIGAPIRTKGKPDIQYADVPFTAQSLLPFMQYLEQDTQMRVGVTKAAAGLDPDAMQSTDKDAVRNTIQLSQGQVELMARNIIETALIPIFRRLLRLSMRHMDRIQMIRHKGVLIPVDTANFDYRLVAEPNVGLGTTSPEQKLQTLTFIYQEQQKYLMTMGMDNPFTSLSQIYNTIEDIVEIGGIANISRYFNYVDKRVEAVVAQQMAQQQAAQAERERAMQPMDPGRSLLMVESMKSRVSMQKTMTDMRIEELKLQQRSLEASEDFDIRRDELAQERVINLAKIGQEAANERIKREQDSNSSDTRSRSGSGTASTGG